MGTTPTQTPLLVTTSTFLFRLDQDIRPGNGSVSFETLALFRFKGGMKEVA